MTSVPKEVKIAEAAETLLTFSVDREDLSLILDSLPQTSAIDRVTIEYEIQILKILMVGWSLSFFMEDSAVKTALIGSFWSAVQRFSRDLSLASSSLIQERVDYFAILKDRLDTYLTAVNRQQETKDPLAVIVPAFSAICGQKDNAVAVLAGSKMFHLAVSGVKHYLESITLEP